MLRPLTITNTSLRKRGNASHLIIWDEKTKIFFYRLHAWVFFVVVSPDGRIVFVSKAMPGSIHDKTHWKRSSGPEELSKNYPKPAEGKTFCLGGDKAYKVFKENCNKG